MAYELGLHTLELFHCGPEPGELNPVKLVARGGNRKMGGHSFHFHPVNILEGVS